MINKTERKTIQIWNSELGFWLALKTDQNMDRIMDLISS